MTLALQQSVPDALRDARLLGPDGGEHRLGDAWRRGDALLVFVRHFACAGCSAHVEELSPRLAELAALAVQVVLIGSGSPSQLAGFIERHALGDKALESYTDPERTAYRLAGFERSAWSVLGPVGLWQLLRAMGDGHVNGRAEGDLYQQGGTLLVDRNGVLRFLHRASALGDRASTPALIDLVMKRRAAETTSPW